MGRIRKPYTLFKRGDIWYFRTYDNSGYRTTAKSTGCSSKAAAVAYCEKLHLTGSLNQSRKTFEEFSKGFFDIDSVFVRDRSRALSMNTINHYRLSYKKYILPYFGKMPLCEITASKIKELRLSLLDKGLSTSGIDNIFAPLKAILKAAYLDDLIVANPMDKVMKLDSKKQIIIPYTLEEIRKIADTIINYHDFVILLTLTGMRASEAIGVTEDDFKVTDKGMMYIDLNKQFDTRQRKYTICKFDSKRKIPVIPEIKALINSFVPYSTLYSALKEAMAKTGIKTDSRRAFHAFRHFFISDTKSKDINPLKVEYIAGHSFKGIEKVYTHMDFEQMEEILKWQKETLDLLTK